MPRLSESVLEATRTAGCWSTYRNLLSLMRMGRWVQDWGASECRVSSLLTALITESDLSGQPTLRAMWRNQFGGRPEDIRGLAADEHVTRLREALTPLVERFNRTSSDSLDALRRQREAPSAVVERARPLEIRIKGATPVGG